MTNRSPFSVCAMVDSSAPKVKEARLLVGHDRSSVRVSGESLHRTWIMFNAKDDSPLTESTFHNHSSLLVSAVEMCIRTWKDVNCC